jgi:signal transduction histidine kinase
VNRGVGIPEGELRTVFDKFAQSSKTRTGAGGTGLGLSICLQIIQRHGGKIWAENAPEGKTQFIFEVPLEVPLKAFSEAKNDPIAH